MTTTTTKGFVALISVIIISAILLGLTTTAHTAGFFSRFNALNSEFKSISIRLAESCNNAAFLKLAQNYNWDPATEFGYVSSKGWLVSVGVDTCYVRSVEVLQASATGKLVKISSSASYKSAYTSLVLTAQVDSPVVSPSPLEIGPTIEVKTWLEVGN